MSSNITPGNKPYRYKCLDCGESFLGGSGRKFCPECDGSNLELTHSYTKKKKKPPIQIGTPIRNVDWDRVEERIQMMKRGEL